MDIFKILQDELQIGYKQVEAAVRLIDEGNTIPFIARYRKEATGSLNDEVLRNLDERLRYLRNLEEKKNQVLSTIRDQEKLTPGAGKTDPGGYDHGSAGGSVPSIPSEAPHPCHDRKGARTGTACGADPEPAGKGAVRAACGALCL